ISTSTNTSTNLFETNKPAGNVILGANFTITGNLNLVSGIITTSSSAMLTFADGATVSGGNNAAYINGPVTKLGKDAFVFPTGKGGYLSKIGLSAPSNSGDAFRAEFFNTAYSDLTVTGSGISNVSNAMYW